MKTYGKRFRVQLPKIRRGWKAINMERELVKQLNIMTNGDVRRY